MRLLNISTGTLPGGARETGRWIADHGPEVINYFSNPANVVAWSTMLVGLAIMALCLTKVVTTPSGNVNVVCTGQPFSR